MSKHLNRQRNKKKKKNIFSLMGFWLWMHKKTASGSKDFINGQAGH